jgi:polar amino acid transport system permease protein
VNQFLSDFIRPLINNFGPWLRFLLPGLQVTVEAAALVILVALAVGLLLALARRTRILRLDLLVTAFVELERGTPALVQLYFVYFALPELHIVLAALPSTVIALGLNAAAYMSENYRGAIAAVPPGQTQAALAVGLTPAKVMRRIVIPQAARIVVPPTVNLAIAEFKDTSLASVIALPELMDRASTMVGFTFQPMPVYVLAAMLYAAVGLPATFIARRLERRMRGFRTV